MWMDKIHFAAVRRWFIRVFIPPSWRRFVHPQYLPNSNTSLGTHQLDQMLATSRFGEEGKGERKLARSPMKVPFVDFPRFYDACGVMSCADRCREPLQFRVLSSWPRLCARWRPIWRCWATSRRGSAGKRGAVPSCRGSALVPSYSPTQWQTLLNKGHHFIRITQVWCLCAWGLEGFMLHIPQDEAGWIT